MARVHLRHIHEKGETGQAVVREGHEYKDRGGRDRKRRPRNKKADVKATNDREHLGDLWRGSRRGGDVMARLLAAVGRSDESVRDNGDEICIYRTQKDKCSRSFCANQTPRRCLDLSYRNVVCRLRRWCKC